MATKNIEQFALGTFNATESTSAGPRWNKYLLRFENMMEAYEISDDKRKKALLLHHSGEEVFDIYSTLEDCKELDYKTTCTKLNEYFNPKKCPEYEIHKFRKCAQNEKESIDEFYTRLRSLAENCEFENKSKEIKMQIIHNCRSNKLRKHALQKSMTLEEILALERSMEISTLRAEEMSAKSERVNKIEKFQEKKTEKKNISKKKCFRCAKPWPHEGQCPAMNKICSNCGKRNHFSVACKSKKAVNNIEEEMEESEKEDSSEAESI